VAGRAVPIWLTEFAWRTAPTPKLGTLSEDRQAELLQQSVDLVRGHEPYVKILVWFLVRDESPTSYWRSGLVTFDWERKKAFDRYVQLARMAPPRPQ
jgi:phosphohistidine phosphatase SixA